MLCRHCQPRPADDVAYILLLFRYYAIRSIAAALLLPFIRLIHAFDADAATYA